MVAAIDIAVVLDDGGMTAGLGHDADAGLLAYPSSQRGIEELHIDFPHVVAHPFVENRADEMSVLLG